MKKLMTFALMSLSVLGITLASTPSAEAHASCRISGPHVTARISAPRVYVSPAPRYYAPAARVYVAPPRVDYRYGYAARQVWVEGHYDIYGRWVPAHYEWVY
jgi:hypothetical protein